MNIARRDKKLTIKLGKTFAKPIKHKNPLEEEKKELRKMRLKISSKNLSKYASSMRKPRLQKMNKARRLKLKV